MSRKASPFAAAALVAALAWLAMLPAAHADDHRGRAGGRGDDRRWVQQAEPRWNRGGDRGGDRRWVQQADPRGGRDWQDRGDRRRLERERPDGWREHPSPRGRHPQDRGGPAVDAPPPVSIQPPPQVQPPPQWQGRGGDGAERRWNPQAPRLRPGDQLPPEYRQRQFVVNDWRAHRLYAPPPGYQWVQPEPGNYILIGRNGEIVNMLVGQ